VGNNVLLSDELVYAAMKELAQKKRAEFRAVWDANGELRSLDLHKMSLTYMQRSYMKGMFCYSVNRKEDVYLYYLPLNLEKPLFYEI
jgi:hypothetical protein